MPRKYELDMINKTDVELAKAGNMQELRPSYLYQKAISEVNCKYDIKLKSNDLSEIMQLRVIEKTLSDTYLQHASDLNAMMFSDRTIRAIGPVNILRGDATGNICRATECGDYKRILYYAFVVFVCGNALPVLEFIICEHNVMGISIALKRFRGLIEAMESVSWPYFEIVIVDWSWVIIHSILIEWKDTNIYEYFKLTCNYVTHGTPYPEKWTIVHHSAVHFLKRVSNKIDVDKSFVGKDFVMDCMAFMVRAQNLEELDAIFDRMMTVLVTPLEHEASNAREELSKMCFEGFEEFIAKTDKSAGQNDSQKLKETGKIRYYLQGLTISSSIQRKIK